VKHCFTKEKENKESKLILMSRLSQWMRSLAPEVIFE
jgi:hypothetical protein